MQCPCGTEDSGQRDRFEGQEILEVRNGRVQLLSMGGGRTHEPFRQHGDCPYETPLFGGQLISACIPSERDDNLTSVWVQNEGLGATGDARQCQCGDDAVKLLTMKEGPNQGRSFWKCKKRQEEEGACKFFEWDDEPPRNAGGTFGNSSGPSRTASLNNSAGSGACFKVCYMCRTYRRLADVL